MYFYVSCHHAPTDPYFNLYLHPLRNTVRMQRMVQIEPLWLALPAVRESANTGEPCSTEAPVAVQEVLVLTMRTSFTLENFEKLS